MNLTNREQQILGCIVTSCNVAETYTRQDVVLDDRLTFYINNIIKQLREADRLLREQIVDTNKLINGTRNKLRDQLNKTGDGSGRTEIIEVTQAEFDLWSVLEPATMYFREFLEKSKSKNYNLKRMCRSIICDWELFQSYVAEGAR